MATLTCIRRSIEAVVAISLVGSGPHLARAALMAGESKIGAVTTIAAGGAAIVAGIKLFAKAGASGAGKLIATKGAAATAIKVGVGTAGSRESLIIMSEHEARAVLSSTTRSTFSSRPDLLAPEHLPDLFRKYPRLPSATKEPAAYEAFLAENPKFLDDASVTLYRREPSLFAKSFGENRILGIYQDRFGTVVHEKVKSQNEDAVSNLLTNVTASLEKKGFPTSKLQGMEEKALEKIVDKALAQEIERDLKNAEYKWAYKSGTLSVKGDIGHFAFEQEVSISGLAKAIAIGAAGASGYKIVWSKDSFVQVRSCIDMFCIDLDSKKRTVTAATESASTAMTDKAK